MIQYLFMNKIELNPWKILSKKEVYETPWIKVTHHNVTNSSGYNGVYGTVHFKNYAIGIIPLDEDYNTWIVGQYRFPINEYTWEIPEGGGLVNTNPLDSAKRELLEEAGLIAEKWELIQELQMSNSVTDEIAFIYLARGLKFANAKPDLNEVLQIKKIPFSKLVQMVMNNEIKDSITVTATLKLKLMIELGLF